MELEKLCRQKYGNLLKNSHHLPTLNNDETDEFSEINKNLNERRLKLGKTQNENQSKDENRPINFHYHQHRKLFKEKGINQFI